MTDTPTARQHSGSFLYDMGGGRYVGVDRSAGHDLHVECEIEVAADGTIKVLDFREYPCMKDATHD